MNNASRYDQINSIVNDALRRGDGTPFFDYLDASLTKVRFFDWFRDMVLDSRQEFDGIIVSGKFGWAFQMYAAYRPVMPPVFNFPGDLRHQQLVDPLIDPMFRNRNFIYFDNSIYKGRTLGQINHYVNSWGGRIASAFVLYDGSRPPHAAAQIVTPFHYIYRWHDGDFRP